MEEEDFTYIPERTSGKKVEEEACIRKKNIFLSDKILLNTYFCAGHKGYKDERD